MKIGFPEIEIDCYIWRARMIRLTRGIIFFAVCAVTMIAAYQFARACQVDEFFLSKENGLAASTPEILNTAIKLDEEGNKEKLAGLLGNGSVIRLKGDIKVQVLERSVEFKTLKIKLPESKDPYWVKDGSLKRINCN